MTLGTLLAAVAVAGRGLEDQQVVILGAGSASIGVADYLRAAMVTGGLSDQDARRRLWIVNRGGLLLDARSDLSPEQAVYAQPAARVAEWPRTSGGRIGLADVIGQVPATILIGLSTVGGAFTEAIVREMACKVDRPIIFPLSNPTDRSEATPGDLLRWTDGRALVATGSPFPPVEYGGRRWTIAQCNNVFIFPAVGLGLVASGARRVTDGMLAAAARALSEQSPAASDTAAPLLPDVRDLRRVAIEIAVAVGLEAQRAGLAPRTTPEMLRSEAVERQWVPDYVS